MKLGELTANVHADGRDSVEGREGRIAGVMGMTVIPDIEFFTFGLIITKHRHYCTFHSKYADRQTDVAFLLVRLTFICKVTLLANFHRPAKLGYLN